jgi:hypothetical protein
MTRCIIHIGMHKTGSTSIQGSLDGFSDRRFYYARLGNTSNHTFAICGMFTEDPAAHLRRITQGRFEPFAYKANMPGDLERSIRAARGRTLIVSGEGIGHLPQQLDLVRMRDYFRERVDEVTIVSYVRAPAGFITSALQQRLRSGRPTRVEPARFYRSYRESFSRFDDVFGRENVRLWKFDPPNFPGGCVVRDFCGRLGIDLPPKRIVRRNDSLSREALGLLYNYFKLGQEYGSGDMKSREVYKLSAQLAPIGNGKLCVSPDLLRPILEQNRADIEWIEARLGQSLHEELGEHQPGDVRGEVDLLELRPEAVNALRALVGERAPAGVTGKTPQEAALLVHALRGKDVPQPKTEPVAARPALKVNGRARIGPHGETSMKVTQLLAEIQKSDPQLLAGIPEGRAEALVAGVFKHMNETIAQADEGRVDFAGLGRFVVRQVEREKDGRKIVRTLIHFRRMEPGAGRRKAAASDDDEG